MPNPPLLSTSMVPVVIVESAAIASRVVDLPQPFGPKVRDGQYGRLLCGHNGGGQK